MAAATQHTAETQLGAGAIAPPVGEASLPAVAPALYHLKEQHDFESQLGALAIAPPDNKTVLPPSSPALHHLKDEDLDSPRGVSPIATPPRSRRSSIPAALPKPETHGEPHTISTQLGPNAIAPPVGGTEFPAPVPELHHLKDSTQTSQSQVGPEAVAAPAARSEDAPEELEFDDIPPFPLDVPTAPLLRISLKRLVEANETEVENLWQACQKTGFFYLDLRDAFPEDVLGEKEGQINGPGLMKDTEKLFKLGEEVFELPTEEKQKYDLKDKGSYFGYKGLGQGVIDAKGTKDRNEFYNVSKDDILGLSEKLPAPETLQQESSRDLLSSYIKRSHAIVTLILQLLNQKLELPPNTLQNLHRLRSISGDQVRWVSSPPQPEDDRRRSLGEHTDFGSITLLHNRLGGLQILPPTSETWHYVKPLKNHCIVNLGDAMVKFTAGILRSNIHRVVNPPGEQGTEKRMSLVYFARPEDEVVLRELEGSEAIKARGKGDGEEITAKEWILRRALGRRTGGDWEKSVGTEGDRVKS